MNNLLDLSGRIALVTGSSQGIGKGLLSGLADCGAKVVVHYLESENVAQDTVKEIKSKGAEVIKVRSDIRKPEEVECLFGEIEEVLGPVDILVNNVGDHSPKHWEDIDFETWERVMATNFTGTYLCSKRALANMREKSWGRIINIGYASSGKGLVSAKNFPYFVSKVGVQMFTRMLASDTSGSGITVNLLSPYVVENSDTFPDQIPMGRPARLEEMTNAMLFFIGQDAEYISGSNLEIHGGWLPEKV